MYHFKSINKSDIRNNFNQSLLHFSVKLSDFKTTNDLLKNGTQIDIMDVFGNTPLSLACIEKPNISIVKLLIRHGADVNFERLGHLDLLLECVLNCNTKVHIEIIKILIESGIYINATDRINNRNCLHYTAMAGCRPLAELLLKKGAFLNIRDNFNFTPIQLAKIHENLDVLALFKQHL